MLIIHGIPGDTGIICNVTVRDIIKCFHLDIPCYLIYHVEEVDTYVSLFERLRVVDHITGSELYPYGVYELYFDEDGFTVLPDALDGHLLPNS